MRQAVRQAVRQVARQTVRERVSKEKKGETVKKSSSLKSMQWKPHYILSNVNMWNSRTKIIANANAASKEIQPNDLIIHKLCIKNTTSNPQTKFYKKNYNTILWSWIITIFKWISYFIQYDCVWFNSKPYRTHTKYNSCNNLYYTMLQDYIKQVKY